MTNPLSWQQRAARLRAGPAGQACLARAACVAAWAGVAGDVARVAATAWAAPGGPAGVLVPLPKRFALPSV
jgi:hypothetical protein